ncbi:glycosyltransferase family 2 protein [Aliiglaciecola sp. CAU 1673]|uniref:glycosyltransferase family 2 protein n=1 Tax=Aliiglaciecola sp. CAU 1673 TaxID=3032595 RepID=UPI0023DC571F|nr:glycosyltransferase family 2 protein [Aliiglaciecola sp. CAU 1673]MDF2179274.1 glycosyltransferase family 2 protein [Aliiglaciecola sp. CAU 1673]
MTNAKVPISVFLVTCNEAKHIRAVLAPLKRFDEVILVDSGSTDGTVDIAREMGAKVVHQDWLGFAKQKEFAQSLCKNEWVMNLDGDEILPEQVADSIQDLVDSQKADALRLYFEDVFWGRAMHPSSGKRSIIRVFKQGRADYPTDRLVHENLVLKKDATEADVPGLVIHFGYGSTALMMEKQNKYSSLKAKEKYQKGKRPSLLKLTLIFPITFVKSYLFRRMFLSGKRGLVQAHIEAMYAFLKEAKLFEHHERRD